MNNRFLFLTVFLIPSLFSCSPEKQKDYEKIEAFNAVVQHDYNSFDISVFTFKNSLSLSSSYSVAKKDDTYIVGYSVEQYNVFDLENGTIPSEMKTTKNGTYSSNDIDFKISNFKFDRETFDDYSFGDGTLIAHLSNSKKYLNVSYDCLDFEITFKYETIFNEIKMNYSLDDGTSCQVIYNNFK